MGCRGPTGQYPAQAEGEIATAERNRPRAARAGRAARGPARAGYPAGVSSEQTPAAPAAADTAGPRPRRLTYAAVLVALEGVGLLAGGIWMAVLEIGRAHV